MIRSLIFITLLPLFVFAQDNQKLIFGAGGNAGMNLYNSSFGELDGYPNCCPEFTSGNGFGFDLNLFGKYKVAKDLYYGARIGLKDISGEFTQSEIIDIVDGNLEFIDGEIEHVLTPKLQLFYFEPNLTYRLTNRLNLNFGIPVGSFLTASFDQKEQITQPTNTGSFWDEENEVPIGRTRNERSGDINNTAFQYGLSVGLDYDFPLNKRNTFFFAPNVSFNYNLSEVATGSSWNVMQLSAGLSFKYKPISPTEVYQKIENIDTVEITEDFIAESYVKIGKATIKQMDKRSNDTIYQIDEYRRTDTLVNIGKEVIIDYAKDSNPRFSSKLIGELDLLGLDEEGNPIPFDKIEVKVELTREIYPLLPYVFFEENSSLIPERYVRLNNSSEFKEFAIPPSALNYHRNNLNIVGKRLQENPDSKIKVQGFVDPITEENKCELAVRRAVAVKSYILKTFGIESERIEIYADDNSCYPKDRTKTESKKGFQENRRVVISTEDPNLLFAVSNAQYQEPKLILPNTILMNLKANLIKTNNLDGSSSEYLPVDFWDLTVNQGNTNLFSQNDNKETAKIPFVIDRFNAASLKHEPLEFALDLHASAGNYERITRSVDVVKDTLRNEVERLTLAVFEVSSAEVTSKIQKEIQRFVKFLDENSRVNIIGYSDDLGNKNDNLMLSKVRAENVKNYIRKIAPKTKFGRVEGVGSSEFPPGLSSYDSPEERFISRTVEIEIRKAISD